METTPTLLPDAERVIRFAAKMADDFQNMLADGGGVGISSKPASSGEAVSPEVDAEHLHRAVLGAAAILAAAETVTLQQRRPVRLTFPIALATGGTGWGLEYADTEGEEA